MGRATANGMRSRRAVPGAMWSCFSVVAARHSTSEDNMRKLIRVDGTEQEIPSRQSMRDIYRLIGCETVDVVQMRHMGRPSHVMLVDDTGMIDGKPTNPKATELYHKNCRPGTIHPICGDVVIVPDADFR